MAKINLELMTGEKLHCSNCARVVSRETMTIVTSDDTGQVTEVLCKNCAEVT